MISTCKQYMDPYGTDDQIKKAMTSGQIDQIEKGIYADQPKASALEIIAVQYPNVIFAMKTAFSFRGLTDVILVSAVLPHHPRIVTRKSLTVIASFCQSSILKNTG